MLNETDINEERRAFNEQIGREVTRMLQRRNFGAQYVPNRQDALSVVLQMIPEGASVARGDSLTLNQLGVLDELRKRDRNSIIDPFQTDAAGFMPEREKRRKMQREALIADIFLTGTNAITLDGKLVNIDGAGNRVSAMVFGPKKVIVVAGMNKIVKDVQEGLERIHNFCAPINARRHYLKHNSKELGGLPCVVTGRCVDCNHEHRICRYTLIVEGLMVHEKERISVILIGEELGI